MKSRSPARTPFDEGSKAAQFEVEDQNSYREGSVEHRNFELGRQYGLRKLKAGITYPPSRAHG